MLTIPTRESKKRKWLLGLLFFGMLVFVFWGLTKALASLNQKPVPKPSQIEVDSGSVKRSVTAYGRLQPRNSSTIIAEVGGTVEKIYRYPGELISQNQLIINLRNPSLQREMEQAELTVLRAKANLKSIEAKLYERQITLENKLALLESEISFAQKELETKAFLLEEAIVAKLDYMRSETSLEQTKLKHQLQQRKLDAFNKSRNSELKAAEYQLEEAKKALEIALYDIEQLDVKAKRSGILNELDAELEVGSSIERGQALAQITDPSNLYADLLISAQDSNDVTAGQNVSIKIRNHIVKGEVLRVYPSAENNQVRLEVKINDDLPESARSNLNISAEIVTHNILTKRRLPIFESVRKSHSTTELFVLRGNKYALNRVQLGLVGNDYVEVVSGIQVNDVVLTSVPEEYKNENEISIDELEND